MSNDGFICIENTLERRSGSPRLGFCSLFHHGVITEFMLSRINLESRLPQVGTTIFTVMSALAQQHGAINLSQGFPDFDAPADLLALLDQHARAGHKPGKVAVRCEYHARRIEEREAQEAEKA